MGLLSVGTTFDDLTHCHVVHTAKVFYDVTNKRWQVTVVGDRLAIA